MSRATIILFLILFAGIAAVLFFKTYKLTGAPEQPIAILRPTPTPKPTEEASIDGTKKLRLEAKRQQDGGTAYFLFTTDATGGNQRLIFQKTLPAGTSLTLHNSWSADGTYAFVEELGSAGENAYVVQATGAAFADGQQALNVRELFDARKTGYVFDKATGWASGTLLILYTKTEQGAKGSSFWFELPSRAFLQLAR